MAAWGMDPSLAQQWADLGELFDQAGLGAQHPALSQLPRVAIALRSRPLADGEHRLGASRLGGQPDLPSSMPWPDAAGDALRFIIQVNLAEVAALDSQHRLPPSGLLSLFADRFGREVRVIYTDEQATLAPRPIPVADPIPIRPCGLDAFAELQLPPPCSEAYERHAGTLDRDAYWDEVWLAWRDRQRPGAAGTAGIHQLLGYCTAESHEEQLATEEVLLGIDSDDRAHLEWGDVHCLWILQDEAALRSRRWDQVRAAM